MEAMRYIEKVTSDALIIEHLGKYVGQDVEIIILSLESVSEPTTSQQIRRVSGLLHKYANPELIPQEKNAWARAVQEKHAIR